MIPHATCLGCRRLQAQHRAEERVRLEAEQARLLAELDDVQRALLSIAEDEDEEDDE